MAIAHCVFGINNVHFFLFALSYRRPDFKCDDDAFYPAHDPEGPGWSRKKRIFEGGLRPPQNLNDLLTPIANAYWFMVDGSYLTINQKRYYIFSTRSFHSNPVRVYFRAYPLEDQSILVQTLKDNFSIYARSSLLSIIYPVFIRSYSNFKRFGLVDLIRPYMHPCFD